MTEVREEITIDAPADAVWKLAGDPGAIAEWLPALSSSRLDGDQRSCAMPGGEQLVERIIEHSDEDRFYVYEILESPLPLRSYQSRFAVNGHDDHAHVIWTAGFETAPDADENDLGATFSEIYRQGLESLRDAVEGRPAA